MTRTTPRTASPAGALALAAAVLLGAALGPGPARAQESKGDAPPKGTGEAPKAADTPAKGTGEASKKADAPRKAESPRRGTSRRLDAKREAMRLLTPGPAATSPAEAGAARQARQVTLFGVIATPGSNAVDPKLASIEGQLRTLLPGHGFRLVDVQSKRVAPGQAVGIDLRNGMVAQTELVRHLDENGKVRLRFGLSFNGEPQILSLVSTPPNQLFFCDKELDGGERLLIGIGAR